MTEFENSLQNRVLEGLQKEAKRIQEEFIQEHTAIYEKQLRKMVATFSIDLGEYVTLQTHDTNLLITIRGVKKP